MWFAKADVKHFKGVALRTFTNIQEYDELKKKKKFRHRHVFQRFCS